MVGHAKRYFQTRIWAAPAALANNALSGWLLGMQRSKTAMALQIVLNTSNIFLDFFFVIHLRLNVVGAAWATVVSQYLCLVLSMAAVWWSAANVIKDGEEVGSAGTSTCHWPTMLRRVLARVGVRSKVMTMCRVSLNIFLRSICISSVYFLLTILGTRLGTVVLAANGVILQFFSLTAFGLDGLSNAAEALVGEAIGARNPAALAASPDWHAGGPVLRE